MADVIDQTAPQGSDTKVDEKLVLEDLDSELLAFTDNFDRQERNVRMAMLKVWRKLLNFWRHKHFLYWDEFAADWKGPEDALKSDPDADVDPALYAKTVNIYRAHGEIIIAALSSSVPSVRFFPGDADVYEDIITARSYSRLSELIQRNNSGQMLFMEALFILYNQGVCFGYNENKEDPKFGKIKIPIVGMTTQQETTYYCPQCGYTYDPANSPSDSVRGANEFPTGVAGVEPQGTEEPLPEDQVPEVGEISENQSPGVDNPDVGAQPGLYEAAGGAPVQCPNCGFAGLPEQEVTENQVPTITGYQEKDKNREVIEVFGPLDVKIPHWVKNLSQTPYLELDTEHHVAQIQALFNDEEGEIRADRDGYADDRYARMSNDYQGEIPEDVLTLRRIWVRPWAYYALGIRDKKPLIKYLLEKYPEGMYIVRTKDRILEIAQDNLDAHWTMTENPMSQHAHADPIGLPVVPIQEMTNELVNITLETIEFGIPETFADPETLDFDTYRESEARPGMVYPAKAKPGQGLANSFYEIKTASLSREVEPFATRLESMAQFVLGSYPSVYGGALSESGGTAKEYEMSKTQALQRLSLTWQILKDWWARLMGKACKSHHQNMQEDEQFVKPSGSNFINVFIRRSQMTGNVGEVLPEISEAFPISWSQKRDILMNLIQLNNEDIGAILQHPENLGVVASLLGFAELYMPGEDDRNKQLREISILLQAEPTVSGMDPMSGEPQMQPSVPIDQDFDKHPIELETCIAWINSEVGQDAKETNPGGFMNVVAHAKAHKAVLDMQAQQQAQQQALMAAAQSQGSDKEGPPQDKE